jgi:pimeloyl-ACP methyl ester carboxylesterase
MKNIICIAVLLLIGISFQSCSKSGKEKGAGSDSTQASFPLPEVGKVIPDLKLGKNASRNFAFYLPVGFDAATEYPVIIFFDPQGKGSYPLELYHTLADKYGFVLAGSNVSKNSLPMTESESDYDKIIDDLYKRIKVHPKGIHLAGFSGGGKTACYVSRTRPAVAGVITCSGPDNMDPRRPAEDFSFYAIAGLRDFNYGSTKSMQYSGGIMKYDQFFTFPDMVHEWPSLPLMDDAFLYMKLKGMRWGSVPKDQPWLDSLYETMKTDYASKTQPLERYESLHRMLIFMRGLQHMDEYKSHDSLLINNPVIVDREKAFIETVKKENQTYDNFTEGFKNWTQDEWKREITRMKGLAEANTIDGYMYSRIIAMLGMNCYKLAKNSVEQSAFVEADKLTAIYEIVEPSNPEHRYFAARSEARQLHNDHAALELEKAAKLGFADVERLDAEDDFKNCRANADYIKAREAIVANQKVAVSAR